MKRFAARFVLALAVLAAMVIPSAPAFAATNPFGDTCSMGGARNSAVCQRTSGDPISSSEGVLHRVTRLLAVIAGVIAVIVIAVGGVRYITSNGDAEQINRAKRTILWAVIGLVVIVLGQTIINFVVSRL